MSAETLLVTSMIAALISLASTPSQPSGGAQFEVVSIKPHKAEPEGGGGMSYLPDGTFTMTNQPIESIILAASPVAVREVSGLPNRAKADSYDIIAKPPAGATAKQRAEMMRNMFAVTLRFTPPGLSADVAPPDDAPQFVTALQEQLGLKLQPERNRVPVFIIDRLERPTPNVR